MFIRDMYYIPATVVQLTIIGSDNGMSPIGGQAIIWVSACLLLMEPFGKYSSEIWV